MIEGQLPPRRELRSYDLRTEPRLGDQWRSLRQRAVDTAIIPEPNFIVLPWMNDWSDKRGKGGIDLEQQSFAAELLARSALDTHPTHVVAIGSSGLPLGKAVHEQLRVLEGDHVRYSEIQKVRPGMSAPVKNHHIFEARSYTEKDMQKFLLEELVGVDGSDEVRVLLIDDVAAFGQVSLRAIEELKKQHGVEVVFYGAYLSKDHQKGLQLIADTGCPAQAVIRVAGADDGSLHLTPEDVAAHPLFPSYSPEIASHADPLVSSPWRFPTH